MGEERVAALVLVLRYSRELVLGGRGAPGDLGSQLEVGGIGACQG